MIMLSGKGQYFKIWDKVSIEKLQNEHQGSWRVNKEHALLCGVMSFVLSWSAHQQHEDAVPGGAAVVQALGSSTRYWALIMSLTSMNIDEIKDPCDNISMEIHANQAPATSSILWKSMQIKPLSLHLFMSLLWLMWWMFCEIKWFESSF